MFDLILIVCTFSSSNYYKRQIYGFFLLFDVLTEKNFGFTPYFILKNAVFSLF